jgi:hypothetical protein
VIKKRKCVNGEINVLFSFESIDRNKCDFATSVKREMVKEEEKARKSGSQDLNSKQWQQIKERQNEVGTLNAKLVETIAR